MGLVGRAAANTDQERRFQRSGSPWDVREGQMSERMHFPQKGFLAWQVFLP
jgi:hypothetical protein